MAYSSLNEFVQKLDKANELLKIKARVSSEFEITEIADRFSKQKNGGKALLFEDTGTNFPLLINMFGSEKRMAMSLGVDSIDEIGAEIESLFRELLGPKKDVWAKLSLIPSLAKMSAWMPKLKNGRGKCQEVVMDEPDITKLPVLKCWPADGGPFVTLPMVITKDPFTEGRNVGMYRMQVFDKNLTGMHWHRHKVGARHFEGYKKNGKLMPIAVALGGDPANTYAATAPLPDNVDEFMLSGFLRKKKVELVKCLTQDLEVPSDADFIIEGYVDPQEDFILEGPFGDHTGFYSLADYFPKFHITCITHRKNAIYPCTIVGIPPMEDAYIGKATERIFLAPIKFAIAPEIIDMYIPPAGVAHNMVYVKINKTFPGQAQKVMNALWGAGQMMFNKVLVVTDNQSDIFNIESVLTYFTQKFNPSTDIYFSNGPLDILDHSSAKPHYGSKMCLDFTSVFPEENRELLSTNIIVDEPLSLSHIAFQSANYSLLTEGISVLIVAVYSSKIDLGFYQDIKEKLLQNRIKMCVLVDAEVNTSDYDTIAWLAFGNIDPMRDIKVMKNEEFSTMIIDATQKVTNDNFVRDWPNIIVSDIGICKKVDERWNEYGFVEFIPSPSEKFRSMVKNSGAVAIKPLN